MKLHTFAFALSMVCVTGATVLAETPRNTLSDQEKADGWKLLFDGESMEHFRTYNQENVSAGWKVVDGAITRVAGAGDLITREKFGSFEIQLDYKISKGGNSGLMFHVVEAPNQPSYFSGPEIQIQDNVDGRDPQKAGWLYQLYSPPEGVDATNPVGEWNTLRVLITPEKCAIWMNDVKYCEFVIGSDDWNERLAKSKFAAWPPFAKTWGGHLCLQDHGDEVAFQNIKIRPLDDKYPDALK